MSAATTGLLAVGPAVVTGILGYAIARLQTKASVQQSASETERLRRQHAEAARQQRQTAYHDLLALMYKLDSLLTGIGPDPLSKPALDAWFGQFQLLYGAIDLFGTDAVRRDIVGIKAELDAMGVVARRQAGGTRSSGFVDEFGNAYAAGRGRLIAAVDRVIDSMRADVMSFAA